MINFIKEHKYKLFIILSIFICKVAYSQLSEWGLIIDPMGYKYYIDKLGKIYVLDDKSPNLQLIESDSIEYYIAKAKKFMTEGKKRDALYIIKSILAMKDSSYNIISSKQEAVKLLQQIQKREGTRYPNLDFKTGVYLVYQDDSSKIYNDYTKFIVKIKGEIKVLKSKYKKAYNNYLFSGLNIGVSFNDNSFKKYDLLISINSEKFNYPLYRVEKYIKHWDNQLLDNHVVYNVESGKDYKIFYCYDNRIHNLICIKYYKIKGIYGYMLRFFISKKGLKKYKNQIDYIINNISYP